MLFVILDTNHPTICLLFLGRLQQPPYFNVLTTFIFYIYQTRAWLIDWYETAVNAELLNISIVNKGFWSYDVITSFHSDKLKDVENIFAQSQSYGRMLEL